jgi:hypothetical protein
MRAGDWIVVIMAIVGAVLLAMLVTVTGWTLATARVPWVGIVRRWLALRQWAGMVVGGRTVRPADPTLDRLARVLARDEAERSAVVLSDTPTDAAVWTWDDRPDYIPPHLWREYVGTADPLPTREAVAAVEGWGMIPGTTNDDTADIDPDPSVVLPDDCPGAGCPDQTARAMLAADAMGDCDRCQLVWCVVCANPNPMTYNTCRQCGADLNLSDVTTPRTPPVTLSDAADAMVPAQETAGGKWAFGADPFAGPPATGELVVDGPPRPMKSTARRIAAGPKRKPVAKRPAKAKRKAGK